ncbi:MAG: 3'-5' exonuclease [Flavobacteriales bacterium]|nr:3'-5' exonuclease [Flavobacteriales bacterium]
MLSHLSLSKILFIDIETAPLAYQFSELDDRTQELWSLKTRWVQEREEKSPEEVYERAGIYAEFSKVICASVGYFANVDGERTFRIKSFCGDDEKALLTDLAELFKKFFSRNGTLLCAHNGKEFDFPFLARRYIINGLRLPDVLDLAGKKPWEVSHLDTMDLWKFGDYKHYTSVDLLSHALGIPSPKSDISGADVAKVYHEDHDLERIQTYCEKDVITVARILARFKGSKVLEDKELVVL